MPIASHAARLLVALCLAVTACVSVTPTLAGRLEPYRPLPGYVPGFVTETDQRPWRDCLWASGSMLLDKWTNGEVTRSHQQLRKLGRDPKGGSLLPDLHVAFARLGLNLGYSPDGGDRITLRELLRRLGAGAGAVVEGNYSKLPRWFGRWDYRFWRGKGKTDNHAVYVERYDRRHGRVWLMDPLARGDWQGEWISVAALYKFAWKSGGALFAATTPTAKASPFGGVTIGEASYSSNATSLTASWALKTPRGWRFQGADVHASIQPAKDPLLAAVTLPGVEMGDAGTAEAPAAPVATATAKTLRATAPLPTKAGAYTATFKVTERRFGRTVATSSPATLFIPGERRATLRLRVPDRPVTSGDEIGVTVAVTNSGDVTWADPDVPNGALDEAIPPPRGTRLVARWIPLEVIAPEDGDAITPPEPVVLGTVPLPKRHFTRASSTLAVPKAPGTWALVIDVVDDIDGSFAAGGSAPAVATVEIVPPHGNDVVR